MPKKKKIFFKGKPKSNQAQSRQKMNLLENPTQIKHKIMQKTAKN